MFLIKSQYAEITANNGLLSDYNAMLFWFRINGIEISTDPKVGDIVNAELVKLWIAFRESLTNIPQRFERDFLEAKALSMCEADDVYELRDCIGEVSDGHLMAIARLFDKPTENKNKLIESISDAPPVTKAEIEAPLRGDESTSESIAIVWHVDDVLDQCPTLSRDEALEVLHVLKRKHDANIGINWEVISIVAQCCYPQKFEESDDTLGEID